VTRRQRGARLKHAYGPRVSVEVQRPCKALWITIEGPAGDWTANITTDSPLLLFLLPGFPPG
jgi:hypothetical protein